MAKSFFAGHSNKDLLEYYNSAAAELERPTVNKFENREIAEKRADAIRHDLRKHRGMPTEDREPETVLIPTVPADSSIEALHEEIQAAYPKVLEALHKSELAEKKPAKQEAPLLHGEPRLREGTKRAVIYAKLEKKKEELIPSTELFPGGAGVEYAVKRLIEKLEDAGSAYEIRRVKEGKVISYGLYKRGA